MATKETPIATRAPAGGQLALPEAPDFMQEDRLMGTSLVQKKIRPPFLKIIQKQSDDEVLALFGIGAAILVPDRILVLEPEAAPVRVVPIYFYIEFLKLSSIKLKGIEQMIVDRSLDPNSDIARRAADRSLWFEDHPQYSTHPEKDAYRYRNVEALSFLCMFQEEHLQTAFPFVLSFMKGSYGKGQQFCNQISMRKRPLFGCVFDLSIDPTLGKNSQGEWRRFLTANPPEMPWVGDPAEYAQYKAMHLRCEELYKQGDIETQYDEDEVNDAQTIDAGAGAGTGSY